MDGAGKKELDVHLEGKKHKHTQFCVVGGAICGDDNSDTEMCKKNYCLGKCLDASRVDDGR